MEKDLFVVRQINGKKLCYLTKALIPNTGQTCDIWSLKSEMIIYGLFKPEVCDEEIVRELLKTCGSKNIEIDLEITKVREQVSYQEIRDLIFEANS